MIRGEYTYSNELKKEDVKVLDEKCGILYFYNQENVLSIAWNVDNRYFTEREETIKILGVENSNLIIKGASEILKMAASGRNHDFCDSYYKNYKGKKLRISNHQTTGKWADVFGYADINIIIFDGKDKNIVEKELNEVGLTISKCLDAGKKAFESIEFERIALKQALTL